MKPELDIDPESPVIEEIVDDNEGKEKEKEIIEKLISKEEYRQQPPLDPDAPSNQQEEKENPRQIVGFGTIPSIKKFLLDDGSDERAAIEKIANKCINDFAIKCATIIDTCVDIPASPYTYIMFMERFGWVQQQDMTTQEGTRSLVVTSDRKDFIENKILEAYQVRNAAYLIDKNNKNNFNFSIPKSQWSNYANIELLDCGNNKTKALDKIRNMFGKNLFPALAFWYNFNEYDNEWQYTYTIVPPTTENNPQQ